MLSQLCLSITFYFYGLVEHWGYIWFFMVILFLFSRHFQVTVLHGVWRCPSNPGGLQLFARAPDVGNAPTQHATPPLQGPAQRYVDWRHMECHPILVWIILVCTGARNSNSNCESPRQSCILGRWPNQPSWGDDAIISERRRNIFV